MSILKPDPIPDASVAMVTPNSGLPIVVWYRFLSSLLARVNSLITLVGTGSTTVGALPSAATAGAGARAFVTDSNSTTFHATVAAGGSNKVPVVSDGTNWLIG